ncbi:hypothetical protein B7H18_26055 [Pseudomonas putida]|uniref:Uncharacterized protein n=1 Tax=Pseudomonas putida TaxID=303 RepID=A0A1X0Z7F7_PSEPU|nr:hypothetical protein B7H18_26055 [Pseudomonas putida]ORL58752.1 hypothetical protein B7H17_24800 [Pseudomonas putida]ORL64179.1 hypothetical protein B7H19_24790 [Pseudomonas putida]PLP92148.1 hypothetical protein CX682_09360 [Pseudomonas sp. FFUP_PS_41]
MTTEGTEHWATIVSGETEHCMADTSRFDVSMVWVNPVCQKHIRLFWVLSLRPHTVRLGATQRVSLVAMID